MANEKKSILTLLDDYRIADIKSEMIEGELCSFLYVESMTNADTISCVFCIPTSELQKYDLKDYVV